MFRQETMMFIYTEALWVVSAFVALRLRPFLLEIYHGSGYQPYTVSFWWQAIGWMAIIGIGIQYSVLLVGFCGFLSKIPTKWKYCVLMSVACIYLFRSVLPLIVTVGEV